MTFIIQTVDGEIVHDFSFTLIEAIKHQNWLYDEIIYDFKKINKIAELNEFNKLDVPVGTVEFVCGYLKNFYGFCPKPKNIPEIFLKDYLGIKNYFTYRNVRNVDENYFKERKRNCFLKSNDKIKGLSGFLADIDKNDIIPGSYQVSNIVDFISEWRCFVWKNKIVGLQHYYYDCCANSIFPDLSIVNDAIKLYSNNKAPIAYTIDIGVIRSEDSYRTAMVEVHDFFSCGLYGFSDNVTLIGMLKDSFYELVKGIKNEIMGFNFDDVNQIKRNLNDNN